jgi:hypothetical protein
MKKVTIIILSGAFLALSGVFAYDARPPTMVTERTLDICELVGYTCIECTNTVGEFEGADFDKPVRLDNGMIFSFTEYNYDYSYRPDVAIFARKVDIQGRALIAYKLVIEGEVYDVTRDR